MPTNKDTQAAGAATLTDLSEDGAIWQAIFKWHKAANSSFATGSVSSSAHGVDEAIRAALASTATAPSAPDSAAPSSLTKPCPFCGSVDIAEGEVLTGKPNGRLSKQSMCRACLALGPEAALAEGEVDYGSVKSSEQWNRRAQAPVVASPPAALFKIEVTPEMIAAAEDVEDLHRRGTPNTWGKVFKAMLSAAQAPAIQAPEAVDYERKKAREEPLVGEQVPARQSVAQLQCQSGETVQSVSAPHWTDGWSPIATAPRDGTNILIRFGEHDGISQAKYIAGLPHPWQFIDTNDGATWLINHAVDSLGGPSHWRHLDALATPSAAVSAAEPVGYRVFLDGNQWCAVGPGFVNIQESPCAFADTAYLALERLTELGGEATRRERRKAPTQPQQGTGSGKP